MINQVIQLKLQTPGFVRFFGVEALAGYKKYPDLGLFTSELIDRLAHQLKLQTPEIIKKGTE